MMTFNARHVLVVWSECPPQLRIYFVHSSIFSIHLTPNQHYQYFTRFFDVMYCGIRGKYSDVIWKLEGMLILAYIICWSTLDTYPLSSFSHFYFLVLSSFSILTIFLFQWFHHQKMNFIHLFWKKITLLWCVMLALLIVNFFFEDARWYWYFCLQDGSIQHAKSFSVQVNSCLQIWVTTQLYFWAQHR